MNATISDKLREHFQGVKGDVLSAQIEWHIAKQLFASGEDNRKLLDWSASYAFWAFQRALYQGVVMAINRLTDTRRDVLSLHRLADDIKKIDSVEGTSIKELLKAAESTFKPLRVVRNNVFGHTSLENFKLISLPGTEPVDNAIETLIEITNKIGKSIGTDEVLLKDVTHYHFSTWGGGDTLLYKLRKYKESVFSTKE